MIRFNLKEYLKNPNRKIVTHDGRMVKILSTNVDNKEYPILFGFINEKNGGITDVGLCDVNGLVQDSAIRSGESEKEILYFKSQKVKYVKYMNIWSNGRRYWNSDFYGSEESAKEASQYVDESKERLVKTMRIEWEDEI